jgi:hypothetical protein
MPGRLRAIATPFVVAPPMGARIRTRLRLSVADQAVLREVGEYLGRLAGQDLGERCRLGHGDGQRTRRKRLLTGACSSRWAGAITRTSQDQWQRGYRNLLNERAGLRRAIRHLRTRLAAPVGGRAGRARGYASRAERWEKQRRLELLTARLAHVDGQIAQGRVSLVRGGRRLLRARHQLDSILAMALWRQRWQAARWFLTADGDAAYPLGNGTILVDPKEGRLELKLPTPLTNLANRPQGRYRLSCSVSFVLCHAGWAAAGRDQPARHPRQGTRLPGDRHRGPQLRRRQSRRPRDPRAWPAREAVPAYGGGYPHSPVPGSAGADVRQPGLVGGGGRPRLHLQVGPPALACSAPDQDTGHHRDGASCGGGGDRTTLAWVSGPATARCAPHPSADGCRGATGQAGHDPGRVQDPTRPRGARQPHLGCKTGRGNRQRARVQVAEDRSRPPISHRKLLMREERWTASGRRPYDRRGPARQAWRRPADRIGGRTR